MTMINEISDDEMEQIRVYIVQGEKIKACKLYKETAGSTLLEAKNFVGSLSEELKNNSPDRLPVGCMSVVLIAFVCTGGLIVSLIS